MLCFIIDVVLITALSAATGCVRSERCSAHKNYKSNAQYHPPPAPTYHPHPVSVLKIT